jgi:hypothetical protein
MDSGWLIGKHAGNRSMSKTYPIIIEEGRKKTFAGSLDWPGWCRIGKDIDSALGALLDYGPRYSLILKAARLDF